MYPPTLNERLLWLVPRSMTDRPASSWTVWRRTGHPSTRDLWPPRSGTSERTAPWGWGSAPTVRGVQSPSQRPFIWKRTLNRSLTSAHPSVNPERRGNLLHSHLPLFTFTFTFIFTFRSFSRRFYQKRVTISTFVRRRKTTIYCCQDSKEVHRTKCRALTISRLTRSP